MATLLTFLVSSSGYFQKQSLFPWRADHLLCQAPNPLTSSNMVCKTYQLHVLTKLMLKQHCLPFMMSIPKWDSPKSLFPPHFVPSNTSISCKLFHVEETSMESVRNNKSNTEQKKNPDMENTLSIIHLTINNAIIKSQIYSKLKYSCIYLHVTSTSLSF